MQSFFSFEPFESGLQTLCPFVLKNKDFILYNLSTFIKIRKLLRKMTQYYYLIHSSNNILYSYFFPVLWSSL